MTCMLGCADMFVAPFLSFIWCPISIHELRRKKASPQGSWERQWATFPTFSPGLGTLKGIDTHDLLLLFTSSFSSSSLCPSPSTYLENGESNISLHTWAEWLYIGDWCLERCLQADRNLWWTVKHGFVYCFSYGLHKQSYSQLMFASSHLQTDNNSFLQQGIMYINKYKTWYIYRDINTISLGFVPSHNNAMCCWTAHTIQGSSVSLIPNS